MVVSVPHRQVPHRWLSEFILRILIKITWNPWKLVKKFKKCIKQNTRLPKKQTLCHVYLDISPGLTRKQRPLCPLASEWIQLCVAALVTQLPKLNGCPCVLLQELTSKVTICKDKIITN